LHIKIVGEILESTFIGNLCGQKEKTKGNGWCFDLNSQDGGQLTAEFQNGGDFAFPVILLDNATLMFMRPPNPNDDVLHVLGFYTAGRALSRT
jgi:hypothetical protein